jgi:hypothetical protein
MPTRHPAYRLHFGMSAQEVTAILGSEGSRISADQLTAGAKDSAAGDEFRLYANTPPGGHEIELTMHRGTLLTASILETESGRRDEVVRIGEKGTRTPHAGYIVFTIGELVGRFGVITPATAEQARRGSEARGLTFTSGSVEQILGLLVHVIKDDARRPGHNGYRAEANPSRGELVVTSAGAGPDFPRTYHIWVVSGQGMAVAGPSL